MSSSPYPPTVEQLADQLAASPESPEAAPFAFYGRLVDGRTGVIRGLAAEGDLYNDEPKFPTYRADVSPTSGFSDGGYAYSAAAGGRGLRPYEAKRKAFFEGVERYCLSIYRRRDHRLTSFERLSDQGLAALDPALVAGCRQAGEADRLRATPMGWTTAWSYRAGSEVFLPAQTVYLPYAFAAGEPVLRDPVTTGAAAGQVASATVLRGLLEVVERDALMVRHYLGRTPDRLDLGQVTDPKALQLLEASAACGLSVAAYDMSLDLPVPVVAVRVRDRKGIGPSTVLGSKASPDRQAALVGALLEALAFRRQLRDRAVAGRDRGLAILNGRRAIESVEDRAYLWAQPELEGSLGYLDAAEATAAAVAPGAAEANLPQLLRQVLEVGRDIVVVDMTTPDLTPYGIVVARVVVPGLQWMHLAEEHAVWSDRIVGFGSATDGQQDPPALNLVPHPYA